MNFKTTPIANMPYFAGGANIDELNLLLLHKIVAVQSLSNSLSEWHSTANRPMTIYIMDRYVSVFLNNKEGKPEYARAQRMYSEFISWLKEQPAPGVTKETSVEKSSEEIILSHPDVIVPPKPVTFEILAPVVQELVIPASTEAKDMIAAWGQKQPLPGKTSEKRIKAIRKQAKVAKRELPSEPIVNIEHDAPAARPAEAAAVIKSPASIEARVSSFPMADFAYFQREGAPDPESLRAKSIFTVRRLAGEVYRHQHGKSLEIQPLSVSSPFVETVRMALEGDKTSPAHPMLNQYFGCKPEKPEFQITRPTKVSAPAL